MAAVATCREFNVNGITHCAYDVDKNGRTLKHGDIVEITGAYFKNDNGLWVIVHAPGDADWFGKDYSLRKLNKNGTLSKSKYNVGFWPIILTINDHMKKLEARAHNAKYAQIEVITPAEETVQPTKDEPKEEPAAEETALVQPAEQAQEAESVVESVVESAEAPAETEDEPEAVPESAGDAPAEAPETVGFHPIINNFPKKSKWDVWNVHPEDYLSSCVVPLVRCDENYHVLDTVYLKVDTPEEVKTLMSAAAVGNRRRWPKYNKQYRRETVQRAADIIEKYYI